MKTLNYETMKKLILTYLLIISTILVFCQKYEYSINLVNVKNDKLQVHLNCHFIQDDVVLFHFPAVIPGHYHQIDYGQFISKLQAFDAENNKLKVNQTSANTFEIFEAKSLSKITYLVDDTWDHKTGKKIHAASGTNFEQGKNFIFNNGGIFGYFSDYENIPFELTFQKPDNFCGMTSMKSVSNLMDTEIFYANNYHELVDSPILFSLPDTASYKTGKTLYTVGVYAESGKKIASEVLKEIIPSLEAINAFTNNTLPSNNYTFLIYLKDATEFRDAIYGSDKLTFKQKIKLMKSSGVGALEHKNSSMYYYVDAGKPESYLYYIKRTITHEVLHAYTPLNLRSNLVADFDYINPEMSQHLWLYEGVTDYLSWMLKVQNNLIDLGEFLGNELRGKMFESNRFQNEIPFTEWSSRILEEEFTHQFQQVYFRGTVTAMMLDFEIMRLTKGEKNLKNVIFQLCEKYGKDNPFDETDIFTEITNLVHSDLMLFFDKYVKGTEKLDYKNGFDVVGINFQRKIEGEIPSSILSKGYGVDFVVERVRMYTIEKVQPNSIFQVGDKIRYTDFGEDCLKPFIASNGEFVKEGTLVSLPIIRNGKELNLKIKTETTQGHYYYKLSRMKDMNKEQNKYLSLWTLH
jgi:predicted metalloprotease with PDZ domain